MMEPKSYNPFGKVGPGESMRLDEKSFLDDRVVDFKHKIVVVNKTSRRLQFYGTAEGAHGFGFGFGLEDDSWVVCNEVIIQISEWPEPKKSFLRRFLDLFKEAS